MFRSKVIPATAARVTLSRSTFRPAAAAPSAIALRRPTTFIRSNHNTPPQNDGPNWPSVASDVVWWTGIVGLAYVVTHPFL